MAGSLLALAVGVRTATTGLRILTLPRTPTNSSSLLQTSVLSMGATRAVALQCGVSLFSNLFDSTLSMNVGSNLARADSGIVSEPFAFPRSGYYSWGTAGFYYRSSYGFHWSSRTYHTADSRYHGFYSSYFGPQAGRSKGYGFTVRCQASKIMKFLQFYKATSPFSVQRYL